MYVCVCMYVCVYVCVYVCICVYACVCMHVCGRGQPQCGVFLLSCQFFLRQQRGKSLVEGKTLFYDIFMVAL